MVSKHKLFLLVLTIITLLSIAILWFNIQNKEYRPGVLQEYDDAVNKAQIIYREKKKLGIDLSSGPCLTNHLKPGWVADLVHNPRIEIDKRVENQCPVYLEGKADHFVELDLDGNVIKVR